MKIRTDFVTNSSSSSFIIAYKNPDAEDIEKYALLKCYDKLIGLVLNRSQYSYSYDEYAPTFFYNKDDWEEWLHDLWSWSEGSEHLKKLDAEVKKLLDEGYHVVQKSVSYDDDLVRDIIDTLEDGKSFIILDKENE